MKIAIKILVTSFIQPERTVIKFIDIRPQIAKANPSNADCIMISDFKLYYRVTVAKTVWLWHQNWYTD